MKRIFLTALVLSSIAVTSSGCGGFLRGALGVDNTPQCDNMENACREARQRRWENRKDGIKNSQDKYLQDLDRRCQQAIADCNSSQPTTRDYQFQ